MLNYAPTKGVSCEGRISGELSCSLTGQQTYQ